MKLQRRWLWIVVALIVSIGTGIYAFVQYNNRDLTPPKIISGSDAIEAMIGASDEELKAGLQAYDNEDGDITDQILIESIQKEDSEEANNIFNINYVVFDKASNVSKLTRKLYYSDYYSPHFNLTRQLRFSSTETFSIFDYVTVTDCIDGDISSQVTLEGDKEFLDAVEAGIYECEFHVTNSVGDTAILPVTVQIYENSVDQKQYPTVSLIQNVLYLPKGSPFDPIVYIGSVTLNSITYQASEFVQYVSYTLVNWPSFTIQSNVNVEQDGCYTVEYTYTDPVTQYKGQATLIVVVEG